MAILVTCRHYVKEKLQDRSAICGPELTTPFAQALKVTRAKDTPNVRTKRTYIKEGKHRRADLCKQIMLTISQHSQESCSLSYYR
jgi:hypothetical protein